jgi:hypothetical protein
MFAFIRSLPLYVQIAIALNVVLALALQFLILFAAFGFFEESATWLGGWILTLQIVNFGVGAATGVLTALAFIRQDDHDLRGDSKITQTWN